MKKALLLTPIFFLLFLDEVLAHCPLCTVGAAAAAGGAAWLGINQAVIGVFIGAFAVSMGWWVSKLIKKQFIPYQRAVLIILSFATTIFPLLAIINNTTPIYIYLFGDYGSLFNRTYLINIFLIGSIIGGAIVTITPWLSRTLRSLRKGKMIPYQGVILTFTLLIVTGGILQLVM